ncbi:MAG: hypothetical protein ACHQIO_05245 [Nevskiales bacterium]
MVDQSAVPPEPSDQGDPKPWTIKGIPNDVRNAVTAAAARLDMSIGEAVTLALRTVFKVRATPPQADGPRLSPLEEELMAAREVELQRQRLGYPQQHRRRPS